MNVRSSAFIAVGFAAVLVAGVAIPAAAQAPEPCGALIAPMTEGASWVRAVGTRVTARGDLGYSSFTMHPLFEIEETPLHTSASVPDRVFWLMLNEHDAFDGTFAEVFTDRGNGSEEIWRFWVYRGGSVWLRSETYGNGWRSLSNLQCFAGSEDQVVLRGSVATATGLQFWTFMLQALVY